MLIATDSYPKEGTKLADFIKVDDEFISGIGGRNDLHQWCIISIPHHPFISSTLEETLNAILDEPIQTYGNLEGLTGPPYQ